ncbi:MAG: SDR family oxidoreductase [Thermomicrobia bacterium]|nr:SDR family oxidoreductase [Thermomicrobia bacterium]
MAEAPTVRRLAGKTALVTGSTRGLGRTMAEWLAREGAAIIVSGREEPAVAASVAAMQALGVTSVGIVADLSRIAEAHRLAEEALARVERLDILVNNAGMSIRGPFWDVADADWEYQTNVNYRSPFILAQHAARQMIARGIRGRIVNISTIGAHGCHKDQWARSARHIPFGRVGRAEDTAAAVRFFCLPESEFTTGQSLLVDGAHHAYLPEN